MKSMQGVLGARRLLVFLLLLFISVNPGPVIAGSKLVPVPAEYGKVIYQCGGKSPNQLFIIGMSHRDALTRANGNNSARVQAEVFKLGEWLFRNEGVELLLPEGFFANGAPRVEKEGPKRNPEAYVCPPPLDIVALEKRLSDSTTFVNAEMLLKKNYPLKLKQIEDKDAYMAAGAFIRKLSDCGNNASEYYQVKSELDYLQEKRTAIMLQKIPGIINGEFQEGNIKVQKGIFTIGLAHISSIIKYLTENKIKIFSPLPNENKNRDYIADLTLRESQFNISILIPRALADDPHALKINKLEKFFSSSTGPSFAGTSTSTSKKLSY